MKDVKDITNMNQEISNYCASLRHKYDKFDFKRISKIRNMIKNKSRKLDTKYDDIRRYLKDVDMYIEDKRKNLNDTKYKDEPDMYEKEFTAGELLDDLVYAYLELRRNSDLKYFKSEISTYLRHTNNKKDDYELYDGKTTINEIIDMKKDRGSELYSFVKSIYGELPTLLKNDRESGDNYDESYYNDLHDNINSIIYEKYKNDEISLDKMNTLLKLASEAVSEEEADDNISNDIEKTEKDLKKTGTIVDKIDKSINISD